MAALNYRVRSDTTAYVWEVFTEDGKIVASGRDADSVTARTVAMLAGMRAMHSSDEPSSLGLGGAEQRNP
jgi:hypothetical protein